MNPECEWPESRGELAEYRVDAFDNNGKVVMFFCKAHLLSYAHGVNNKE